LALVLRVYQAYFNRHGSDVNTLAGDCFMINGPSRGKESPVNWAYSARSDREMVLESTHCWEPISTLLTFTWSGLRGAAGYTESQALLLAIVSARPLRILNSLQTLTICRSIVITLVRSGGLSKQCPQYLTVPPTLKIGLPPFLIIHQSSILRFVRSHLRTSLQALPLLYLHIYMRNLFMKEHVRQAIE
jgi:hypothetical protein